MNSSVAFIEKIVNEPQYAGLGPLPSLELATTYLSKYGYDKNSVLLEQVIKKLYDSLNAEALTKYEQHKELNPYYAALQRLLLSKLEKETLSLLMKIYRTNSSNERPLYGLLEFILESIQKESSYLAKEELQDYFYSDTNTLSEEDQMIYCLHTINVGFAHFSDKDFAFSHDLFSEPIKNNLLKILHKQQDHHTTTLSIWALYWFNGGYTENIGLAPFTTQEQDYLYQLLSQNPERKTCFRIAYSLIKYNDQVFTIIKNGNQLTDKWLGDLTDLKIQTLESKKIEFVYSDLIERNLINYINEKDSFWLNDLIIPYLGTQASEAILTSLFPNFESDSDMKLKITSAIILRGANLLTNEKIIHYGLDDDQFVDEVNKIYIRKKGHLIHKLKAKDTTGRWAYYFVLVEYEREAAFLQAIEGDDTIDLEDYGKVIDSCYGEVPTEQVKQSLKEKYDFDV